MALAKTRIPPTVEIEGDPAFPSKEEIVNRGKAMYEEGIRRSVEANADNLGKYLVLDINTGCYEVDEDLVTAGRRARATNPGSAFFAICIGEPTLAKL